MTVAVESSASVPAAGHQGLVRVDLRALDYHDRRQRLLSALRALAPGEEMQVLSDRDADVYWLRYEIEVRMPQRYRWSLPREDVGTTRTTVRLP